MNKLIACCGLDCEKCDAYIATINNDDALREKVAKLWAKMNNAPITPEMITCTGCRMEGAKTPYCGYMCEIRKCVIKKGFDTCAKCSDMENCETVGMVFSEAPQAIINLQKLKG